MSSPFDDTPESLVELRTTVMDWVKKSREAVLSFQRDDGSFWRDTKQYKVDFPGPAIRTIMLRHPFRTVKGIYKVAVYITRDTDRPVRVP